MFIAHVGFKGLVDLDLEIAKCGKKLDLAQLNLDKIVKIESQPNYEETIPANVRLANEDKVCIDAAPRVSCLIRYPARGKLTKQKSPRCSYRKKCLRN